MPYKDLELKRQWEREHREERNARRRKSPSSSGLCLSEVAVPKSDVVNDGKSENTIIINLAIVFAFVLFLLFAGWRFRRAH